jgi:hypothetical protein
MELINAEMSALEVVVEQQKLDASNQLGELALVCTYVGGMGDVIGV